MSYTSHAEQTIQVMATRDLIQNSILEQNELKQRGILKDIQHQEPFPPKTTFFIKQDVDLNGELSMYYIMNPQINSLLLFKFYTEPPATFHLVPHTQRLYSLISPQHHEPLHKSICIGLTRESGHFVLLLDQRMNSMEKKKPNQDGQLSTLVGIQTRHSHNP